MFSPGHKLLNENFSPRCEIIPFLAISHRYPKTSPQTTLVVAIALDFPSKLNERHSILAVKHRRGKVTLSPSWIVFLVLKGAMLPAERKS